MIKKDAPKRQGSIATRDMIKTRNFITVMSFQGITQMWVLASFNINLVWSFFSLLMCLPPFYPLLYLLNSFLWVFSSCFIDHSLFQSLCMICLKFWLCVVFIDCLNLCDDRPVINLSSTNHIHAYNRLFKKGMIWCKN